MSLMKNKTVLITGGTSGIGKAAAEELSRLGARVVFTYREKGKGERTLEEIKGKTGNRDVDMMELNLASLESVRTLAGKVRGEVPGLNVLINNAGGYYGYRKTTSEGYEYTFGVNHLGHFLLTLLLKDVLVAGTSRIINVSSEAQRIGHIRFGDLMGERRYSGLRAYSQAKLANLVFTFELSRRWAGEGITVNAVHPGAVRTNFGNEAEPLIRFLIRLGKPFLKSPARGADTLVYLASSPEVAGVTGGYFASRKRLKTNREAADQMIRQRLWEVSEDLCR